MDLAYSRRRARLSWLFVGTLFVLGGMLGALQYRWIGEVSVADRERLRSSLQASLDRLSREFNNELTAACAALLPPAPNAEAPEAAQQEYAARYAEWKKTTRQGGIFSAIAVAAPHGSTIALHLLNLNTGVFEPAEWPARWSDVRERMEARLSPGGWQSAGVPLRRPPQDELVFELPRLIAPPMGNAPRFFGRRETQALIVEFSLDYLRGVMLPEVVQRHLEAAGRLDYLVEVVPRGNPDNAIYRSAAEGSRGIAAHADASAGLLDLQFDRLIRRFPPRGRERAMAPGPPPRPSRAPGPDAGRWQIFVRHRAGSLDAVVSRARWRNLGVTGAILLLMAITAAALIRYMRDAQKLAELQMNFVAGVSHELRTPLTVLHTAGYNLRGQVARNPAQVERYGALIQQESERLRKLVEQVLGFANADAGRVIRTSEPVLVESVIDDAIESSRADIEAARCTLEKSVGANLPALLGDPVALKHALGNLLSNAAKYGARGGNWIGIFASAVVEDGRPVVEIRVADRGPGIPRDEQKQIFDPFFRGAQALRDQVHGTGLGLNLAKKIVEAHGGSLRLKNEPGRGAEFIVRIPAVHSETSNELAHSVSRG